MKMLSPKEIVKRSYERTCEQGDLSQDWSGSCYYYQPETKNRCSVGILLTEEDASLIQEELSQAGMKNTIFSRKVTKIFKRNGIDLEDADVREKLGLLQSLHDDSKDFDEWKTKWNWEDVLGEA